MYATYILTQALGRSAYQLSLYYLMKHMGPLQREIDGHVTVLGDRNKLC